jgi:hypothetical protein
MFKIRQMVENPENYTFEIWSFFAVPLAVAGALSNIYFLISVAYAKSKNRHGFDGPMWLKLTVYLLNLALVDSLYCLLLLGNGFVGLLGSGLSDTGTPLLCKFLVLARHNLILIDGWSTGAIAFNAAFPKLR